MAVNKLSSSCSVRDAWGVGAEGLPRQSQHFRPELTRGWAGAVSKKGREKTTVHVKIKSKKTGARDIFKRLFFPYGVLK